MIIDISRVYENVVDELPFKGEAFADVRSSIRGHDFFRPVFVDGMIRNRAGVVTLEYTAESTFRTQCDRCLKELERDFSLSFEHILVRHLANGENDDYIVTQNDRLDMDDVALNDVLLEMPTKMLCSEDCKGLCPVCGADLNTTDCGCAGKAV